MENKTKFFPKEKGIKSKLYEIIFEADTPAGKWFDIILLWAILLSMLVAA